MFSEVYNSLNNKQLELILLPTEQCNFRCTYCYEDYKINKMDKEVINSIKLLIKNRSKDLKWIKISWFGGEPLLEKEIIYDISAYVLELSKENNIKYTADMTTNGYLLNIDTINKLNSLGIKHFQISLDGYRDIHNLTRHTINNKGTFDTIWNNFLEIKKSKIDCNIMIRLHFSPDNLTHLNTLIDAINKEFSDDNRFSVLFRAIGHLGGKNDSSMKIFSNSNRELISKGLQNQLKTKSLNNKLNNKINMCYAAKPNSFIIRPNGYIYKCTVALNDNRNRLGKINPDGSLSLNKEYLRNWIKGIETLDSEMLRCPYNHIKNSTCN